MINVLHELMVKKELIHQFQKMPHGYDPFHILGPRIRQ